MISIHALRGEDDDKRARSGKGKKYFNPRPPWGGRQRSRKKLRKKILISIHALRGEDDYRHIHYIFRKSISIHALRGEDDFILFISSALSGLFQSTPSVGRTTILSFLYLHGLLFQSTPSVGRTTAKTYKYATLCLYIVHIKLYIFATAVLFT